MVGTSLRSFAYLTQLRSLLGALHLAADAEHDVAQPDRAGVHLGPGGIEHELLVDPGIERRIALVVPGYIEALHVTARTDLVAFVPRRLIGALSKQLSLATITPPFDPGIDEQFMFYPTRAQMDPGSIWLRTIMLGIGREMQPRKV